MSADLDALRDRLPPPARHFLRSVRVCPETGEVVAEVARCSREVARSIEVWLGGARVEVSAPARQNRQHLDLFGGG